MNKAIKILIERILLKHKSITLMDLTFLNGMRLPSKPSYFSVV
jgi:hypothetical protein